MEPKKITILDLQQRKADGQPLVMITAYDYASARLVDQAGVDLILVGDSLGMVMLGYDSTVSVTMADMIHHSRAVTRGTQSAFVVGDLPFMSYQAEVSEAVRNAGRLMKEAQVDAVKLEGGAEMADTVRAIVRAGIPVMGHVGLTPQSLSSLGGYKVQARTAVSATKLLQDALALQEAGCFAVVLEAVPARVADVVTELLTVPTIGIGAGVGCAGQVLVYHDMLQLLHDIQPRFVKPYGNLGAATVTAVRAYAAEVRSRAFPAEEHTYKIKKEELDAFLDAANGFAG